MNFIIYKKFLNFKEIKILININVYIGARVRKFHK